MITPMCELPQALYRAQDVRELDRIAMADQGIPAYTLMTRAGGAAFQVMRRSWPRARRVAVLCGTGNNGGDGMVVARLAREAGLEVQVMLLGRETQLQGAARQAYEALRAAGVRLTPFAPANWFAADVVVDAFLGTGLDREVTGRHREAIELLNKQDAPVLSLDVPSGLQADTGVPMGVAVRAAKTVTFIGLKQGLFTGEGPDYCGEILFEDLAVPAAGYRRVPNPAFRITQHWLARQLPPRPRSAHKGRHGHVLVVGGAQGMAGAVRLAGEAAARVGAGLVTLATHPYHAAALNAARPELMCHGVAKAADLSPLLQKATVVAIGPGLGRGAWGRHLLGAALDSGLPLVVDADALDSLAREPLRRNQWILTPHPGEAARLLETDAVAVQADRWRAVRELQMRYGGVVVLKGAGTLICHGHQPVALCDAGNPGMAVGGMGDLLTGAIAGLAAQGLSLWQAALAGVYLHAHAGDVAARGGERGMMAGDLLAQLRRGVNPRSRS